MNLTIIPRDNTNDRVESGPIQFGDDWPGIFLRGDFACPYGRMLQLVIETVERGDKPNWLELMQLKSFAEFLQGCDVRTLNKSLLAESPDLKKTSESA